MSIVVQSPGEEGAARPLPGGGEYHIILYYNYIILYYIPLHYVGSDCLGLDWISFRAFGTKR